MIAQSQSGTGKTATFSLALLSRIDPSKQCTQVKNKYYHRNLNITKIIKYVAHAVIFSKMK